MYEDVREKERKKKGVREPDWLPGESEWSVCSKHHPTRETQASSQVSLLAHPSLLSFFISLYLYLTCVYVFPKLQKSSGRHHQDNHLSLFAVPKKKKNRKNMMFESCSRLEYGVQNWKKRRRGNDKTKWEAAKKSSAWNTSFAIEIVIWCCLSDSYPK